MVNKVFLIGRLGKDPVIKHFSNDNAIAEFTIATDDSYKNREGQKVEQTDWHNIKIPTKKLAEVAEKYLRKGSQVFIEGKIKNRSYDDKDGNKRYITEIIVESFKMLDSKRDSGGGGDSYAGGSSYSQQSQQSNVGASEQAPAHTQPVEDDLPF